MNTLNNLIRRFSDRYDDLAIDPAAKFLRPALDDIISKLKNNDIIGAHNVAISSLEKADNRDTIKIQMFIDIMEIDLAVS